jgi:succinate-semialdehyde dehydrogenase/glutarate-semialdehyde dehydrogenase
MKEVKNLERGRDVGNMVNKEQFEKVEEHIRDAVSKGAKILFGGKGNKLFFEPTILTDVTSEMKVISEETFGPVLPIISFKDDGEAVKIANDSKYGLGVTIWTKDTERGKMIGDQINVGMVWVNDINIPFDGGNYWGGVKESGMGSTESKIMQCLKKKSFMVYSGKENRGWWFPY